jgi:hypothetical protein
MRLVFLTPLGALVGLGIVIPLTAAYVREKRSAHVRHALGLAAPLRSLSRTAAVSSVVLLVAAAAAQPAISRRPVTKTRTDAATYFVIDVSRSMLASPGRLETTRFERAIGAAEELRADIADVPAGLASFTDRVIPNLLPSTDRTDFRAAANQALAIDSPPPEDTSSPRATNLGALVAFATGNYFVPRIRHRLVIALTDGESESFEIAPVAQAFRRAHIHLLVIRTWRPDERIYDQRGHPDPGYTPDSSAGGGTAELARTLGGAVYGEHDLEAVATAARRLMGRGPTLGAPGPERLTPLAAYLIAATAVPVGLLLLRRRPPTVADDLLALGERSKSFGAAVRRPQVGGSRADM